MNAEEQQHHQAPLAPSMAAPPPTTTSTRTTTSEYANINICDGTPLLQQSMPPAPLQLPSLSASLATSSSNASLSNAAFVTLGLLAAPMSHHHAAAAATTISPTSTSTFKTPLLPMPSLEDIEGSIPRQNDQEQIPTTTQPQQMHPQPIPGGILKYPPPPAVTNTIAVGIPLGLGPGPEPPPQQPTLLSGQEAFPSPPLLMSQASHVGQAMPPAAQPQQQQPPSTLALNDGVVGGGLRMNTGILRNSAMTAQMATAHINLSTVGSSSNSNSKITLKSNAHPNMVGGVTAAGNSLRQKPTVTSTATAKASTTTTTKTKTKPNSRKCCCACFGGGGGTQSGTKKSNSKHKRKAQTFCSALLTNLGICALLVAYTLLGSFIFLTIESEDSTALLQRTLASTKRVGNDPGGLSGGGGGGGRGANNQNNNHNNNNLLHTQRSDNGTLTAAAATSSHTATYPAASSSSSPAAASYSSSTVLEGIIPLSNVGDSASSGGHNDFTYSTDNDIEDGNAFIAAGDGASSSSVDDDFDGLRPQLALSADTYDVRQRTIENIWDITVSLNILYKENWTKLAALEIAKFQDQLIKRLNEDTLLQLSHDIDDGNGAAAGVTASGNSPATEAVLLHSQHHYHHHHHHHNRLHHGQNGAHEWNFAKAFLYSLTVLTTIGYGNIAPRTTLGRLVTLIYALFGIPLTLVYLSSTGGILAKIAREVFSKALCCCLCSNCGYCCYDERRMAEKERRMKRKRQQEELRKQQSNMQEPFYVRSGSMNESSFQTPEKQPSTPTSTANANANATPTTVHLPDIDSLSASESRGSMHGLSILAPILLCLSMMVIYIVFGALVLYRLEEWPLLDGIYFCFMSLSTIGFGDMLPGLRNESTTTTTWFCSMYIMSGMALTAMCFNVIHEEIVHRIRIVVEFKQANGIVDTNVNDEQGTGAANSSGIGNSGYYLAS